MTKQEKTDIIHKWLLDNDLYYHIDPFDGGAVNKYLNDLLSRSSDLYKYLLSLDIVKEDSYNDFIVMLERNITLGINKAVFGM